jgi:hypothetical protein
LLSSCSYNYYTVGGVDFFKQVGLKFKTAATTLVAVEGAITAG